MLVVFSPKVSQNRRLIVLLFLSAAALVGLYWLLYRQSLLATVVGTAPSYDRVTSLFGLALPMLGWLAVVGVNGVTIDVFGIVMPENRWLYAPLVVLAAAALWVVVRGSWSERRRIVALCAVVVTVYGAIALARAPLLVMALNQSLRSAAGTARYHYVGQVGLTLLIAVVLGSAADRWKLRRGAGLAICGVAAGLALVSAVKTARGVNHHEDARRETDFVLSSIRKASHKASVKDPNAQRIEMSNQTFRSVGWCPDPANFPGWAAVFLIFHPDLTVQGRHVYFVEDKKKTLRAVKESGGKIADILIPRSDSHSPRRISVRRRRERP
jgi:hypothetical protein